MDFLRLFKQPVSLALFAFSVAVHALLLIAFLRDLSSYELLGVVTFAVLLGSSATLSFLKPVVTEQWSYAVVVTVHMALSVAVLSVLRGYGFVSPAWTAVVLAESVLYVRTPAGMFISIVFVASYVGTALATGGVGAEIDVWTLLQDALVLALVAAGAIVFRVYREELVEREEDVHRLDGAVLRLSRANMSYQEHALDAEERSTEQERQRITRDIHDLVGYTLTNSIVTMEAAVDMIRMDPLRVPALLQSARDNAEEGLSQIRESLYHLRERKPVHPKGVAGVSRMVHKFKEATGIEVELEIGGVPPIRLGDGASHVTHHFVQEAMINSFRHGRATKILVMLYWADDHLAATVWDNGPGKSISAQEGIGISGMRERAEQVGGTVSYEKVIDGFSISLLIPREHLS